ncbi:dihydroxyacetone kinase subunit DhaK [Dactylosporangium sp. NPDC000521]|uniref:dihydroxyacetone kinase subunit DhaK n=1 Tax=Dactylosporangium sp. NPDC000521 TaxID=3363975 RepID=UPI003676E478
MPHVIHQMQDFSCGISFAILSPGLADARLLGDRADATALSMRRLMSRSFIQGEPTALAASLAGFARANSDLVQLVNDPVCLVGLHRDPRRQVGLVSGGGSGHEPLHSGFIGVGMLDAVAPGRIFASPHNSQILEASRRAALPGGVLHIVKNYTGDRINFGIAAERLRAEGIEVGRVLIDDDLATESDQTATGRRGTGATVVVEKVLGAAADRGDDLRSLMALGQRVAGRSRSLAVASGGLTSPQTGAEAFAVPDGMLEYGVGIHGERAPEVADRPALAPLVFRMTDQLLAGLPDGPDDLIAVVNGLGGTTQLELFAIYEHLCDVLDKRGQRVVGRLVGTYVPALDMPGFSLTLTRADDETAALWHAPCSTPTFNGRFA